MYEANLVRSEFGSFWRKKRDVRFDPPTRVRGSIDPRHLSRIVDDLNGTDFDADVDDVKSEEFRNFVENPIDVDFSFVDQLENPVVFATPLSSSTSASASSATFFWTLLLPWLLLFLLLKRFVRF